MDDILFRLLLGHLWGDYLFQTTWMAENKKKRSLPCILHCLSYTWIVIAFVPEFVGAHTFWTYLINIGNYHWFSYVVIALVFLSHYMFDRTEWVVRWLMYMRGESYAKVIRNERELHDVSILTFVYIMMDNTLHLTLMYIILKLVIGG